MGPPAMTRRSVTLIELLIVIVLFTLVVLSFSSIDLFSRRQVLNLERQTGLQNEASTFLMHMSKNMALAIGGIADYPVTVSAPGGSQVLVEIDIDSNGDGLRDKTVAYLWNATPYAVEYDDNYASSSVIIAENIRSFSVLAPAGSNYVELNIVACQQPAQAPSYYDNPCVTMATRVTMPSVSTN